MKGDNLMNQLQIFNYNSKIIRTVQRDGEIWFVLRDVCQVLDLGSPHKVADRLDTDEKGRNLIPTPGGDQETTIINESGLYHVILRSDKPEAKPFRKWVTSEVLPSIRRHGLYATPDTIEKMLADPDTAIKLLTTLKVERSKRQALEAELDRSKEWYSIKRVAHMNGKTYKDFDWRELKKESEKLGLGVKKIFDANYGEVNTYHVDVWANVYPRMEL